MCPKFDPGCSWEGCLSYGKATCSWVGKGTGGPIWESKLGWSWYCRHCAAWDVPHLSMSLVDRCCSFAPCDSRGSSAVLPQFTHEFQSHSAWWQRASEELQLLNCISLEVFFFLTSHCLRCSFPVNPPYIRVVHGFIILDLFLTACSEESCVPWKLPGVAVVCLQRFGALPLPCTAQSLIALHLQYCTCEDLW